MTGANCSYGRAAIQRKANGPRNATTLAIEALLDGEAVTLTRKAVEWHRLAAPLR